MMELERQTVQATSNPDVLKIAEETLRDLIPFTHHIELAAEMASKDVGENDQTSFLQLIDHLAVFSEAILAVKETMQITGRPKSNLLEEELLILTRSLLQCKEDKNRELMVPLLAEEIPRHFKSWRDRGIPALQAYREM